MDNQQLATAIETIAQRLEGLEAALSAPRSARAPLTTWPWTQATLDQGFLSGRWIRRDGAVKAVGSDVILTSPGGTEFTITIGDDGRLQSTPVVAGTPVTTFAPVTLAGLTSAAAPTGTTSATYVMMGLSDGGLNTASAVATRAFLLVEGNISNTLNNGTSTVALCIGTGTAPKNGDPQIGTQLGQPITFKSTTAAGGGQAVPFTLAAVSDVTPGVAYWIDLALLAGSGTAAVSNLDLVWMGLA